VPEQSADSLPRVVLRETGDEIDRLIRSMQTGILKHPAAAQAIFNALVAEGRRFAETDAGREWKQRLCASALLQRAQSVFHTATLWLLEDDHASDLPSGYLDAIFMAVESSDLESLLQEILAETANDDE
jgi:hypothetical protein